jgi:hypothetical protein
VPEGTSRLRLTVMATHREAELRHAANVIGAAARELDLTIEASEWDWEEPVPRSAPVLDRVPAKPAPAPAQVPSLASQMPPGPLSIDLDEAA